MHIRRLVQAIAAGGAAYLLVGRPWERWGASAEEARAPLPGDQVVPHPTGEATHAATIGVPPEAVWPWLAQMGCDRGGWYTCPWIEGGHPDPDRIHPKSQHIAEGDLVPDSSDGSITWTVAAAEQPRLPLAGLGARVAPGGLLGHQDLIAVHRGRCSRLLYQATVLVRRNRGAAIALAAGDCGGVRVEEGWHGGT